MDNEISFYNDGIIDSNKHEKSVEEKGKKKEKTQVPLINEIFS